jgi:uncharacterized protein YcfL
VQHSESDDSFPIDC